MNDSRYNRSARRSGGERPARFSQPNLSPEDVELLRQEAIVRARFGEAGVKRFWKTMADIDTGDGDK